MSGLGNSYSVGGIGINDAQKIAFKGETMLTSGATYADARNAMIEAASQLYEPNSCEVAAVTNAWYAVGIGDSFDFSTVYPINGADNFCTTATYSLDNIPATSTVNWSVSPLGIATLITMGQQATLTKSSDGTVTLTATATACNGNFSVSKAIEVGAPTISGSYITNGLEYGLAEDLGLFEPYNPVCFITHPTILRTTMDIQRASSVTWTRTYPTGPGGLLWSQLGDSLGITFRTSTESGIFQVEASNTCGTNSKRYSFKAEICGQQFIITPNPANNNITISLLGSQNTNPKTMQYSETTLSGITYIKDIRIYNIAGALQKQQIFSGNNSQEKMSIAGLPSGIYFVKISDGKHVSQQKLVVQ